MSLSPSLRLYWDTVRHLRPVQVYSRLRLRALRPRPDTRPALPSRAIDRMRWVAPAARRQTLFGSEEFRLLGQALRLRDIGWDDPGVEKLWRYNLHYFDDLTADGAKARADLHAALILRWIAANPPASGTGWEPYPTSLRIVNWVKWTLAGNVLPIEAVQSLAVQARWLACRLEYHLLGNHLFANAKALVFAGCLFVGGEAEGWLGLGLRILAREVPEQILPDGGHFELSPMYHAIALEDMLDLINLLRAAGRPVPGDWPQRSASMRSWLAAMCHPDGEIAFFNDAAIGIAPHPQSLQDYAERLGLPAPAVTVSSMRHLTDSGYVRLESPGAVALLDVARVGPNYLPGHAHADTLSFELSVGRQRAIVNSGTSVYGSGPERLRQRGTPAHNTVTVDGADSSEVWSGFRVARRARPFDLALREDSIACSHDGYARLPGRPVHRRCWHTAGARLSVSDTITGGHAQAVAAFHFHPALTPTAAAGAAFGSLSRGGQPVLRWRVAKGAARLEPSTWHPEFGRSEPASRLLVTLSGGESVIEFSWDGG